jgi:hypothetical protein
MFLEGIGKLPGESVREDGKSTGDRFDQSLPVRNK